MKSPCSSALQVLLLLGLMTLCIDAYKPVIIVHGILDGPKEFTKLIKFITTAHNGTKVKVIDLFDYLDSLQPMWKQVEDIGHVLQREMDASSEGIHLLCFSQGGLICRALIATNPYHNVHTFISLSSPQAGQFGETEYIEFLFPDNLRDTVYEACYSTLGRGVSICDYWKDPHHRVPYLQYNSFLAYLDGEKHCNELPDWRLNFLAIKKLVLIGGPDDGVITPWQSSQFGFYDIDENVIEMRDREVYSKDIFGLKTLDERGDLVECVMPGVRHVHWHSTLIVFQSCMEKWLI